MLSRIIICLLFAILHGRSSGQQTAAGKDNTYPEVTLRGTQLRTINSAIVSQEYELKIMLPAGYNAAADKKYTVLYLMDGQWDFALLTSLYGQQYFDGFIPEMIVVAVSWAGPNANPDSLRARDYTPTNEARIPQSGGAPKFLSFIKQELIPFIQVNYKADDHNRLLAGCSLGGLFTLYALFTEPGLFQGYIAASPAFGWDKEVLYSYENKYFESKNTSAARLFIAMGGVERSVPGFEKLATHLLNRNYQSLKIKTQMLENTGHSGTKAEGFARGLQFVFERPSIDLDYKTLNRYTGSYQLPNGSLANVKQEHGKLVIYFNGNNKYALYASAETDFYATSEYMKLQFKVNGDAVDGFQLARYGSSQFAKKIK